MQQKKKETQDQNGNALSSCVRLSRLKNETDADKFSTTSFLLVIANPTLCDRTNEGPVKLEVDPGISAF
jgi:hypothetical protein